MAELIECSWCGKTDCPDRYKSQGCWVYKEKLVAEDGIIDGGALYTNEELAILNSE